MKDRLTSKSLLLTGLNTSDSFPLKYSGRTSFQPIGTVTGTVKLQFSNDNINFFDLETGLDVSQPFLIETTDYIFYRFVVTTIGTGTVKWSIANSDTVQDNITVSGGGGSGGVSSFNTRTGSVVSEDGDYDTNQIAETPMKVFVTPSEKTAITHSNRSVLNLITEAFTTGLKTAYDSTVTWISTNGANIISHLSSTSNPHNVTKSQVGLSNVDNTSDLDKPTSTATQTQIDATNTAFNDFVTVDYINDLNAKQDTLESGVNIKTVEGVSLLGSGNLRLLDETRVFLFNDFLSATALQPFVGGAISTGTIAQNTTNFSANTLGVCRITKSTTANSGYRVVTDSNAIRLKGGEVYPIRFCLLNNTTQTFRGGFMDATTVTESVDGVYFQIANSGDLVLKTSNNSVRTTSSVLATLVVNTWYKIEVVIGAGATSAYMNLYDATGTLIGSTTPITTNIPTGVGRETGCGFVSTGSSVTADALLDIDFHYFEQTLTR